MGTRSPEWQFLPEFGPEGETELPDRLGRCYQLAAEMVMYRGLTEPYLVHGTLRTSGRPPLLHSWIAVPDGGVIDPVLLKPYTWDAYVRLMGAEEHCRHGREEVFDLTVETGRWGPWGGRCDPRSVSG